ncbi:MAG: PGF-CTERM sorting domain-containing protein [Haloferacaceae archaeon]
MGNASVAFGAQTSGGETVTVDSVTLPEGGFVTVHDASLQEGNALGSVVGSSSYLEAGTHENVTVKLDDGIDSGTLIAMPHRDTDGDRIYEFVSSGGNADGPYVRDGSPVTTAANVTVSATVQFSGQPSDGRYVVVDRVELSAPGFVTVHDSSLQDGATFESVRGTSERLPAGVHENVRVRLDEPLQNDDTLLPMAHRDTNDNGAYDFVSSDGAEDGPFLTADGNAVLDAAQVELASTGDVSFAAQSTGGNAVVVDSVYVPNGGFVTIHDATLADGATFDSVRGTSAYLEPGLHRSVRVSLDDPVNDTGTLIAMPHRDTNDNEAYDFVSSDGENDGPYTDDGAVTDGAEVTVSAAVSLADQPSGGHTVVVDSVDLSEGGFVTLHDARLFGGDALGSVVGTSGYLDAGVHENVEVTLDEPIDESRTLIAMPHRDTNDNEAYDFVSSDGGADGPYTADGGAVTDPGKVSVTAMVSFADQSTEGETVTVERATLHDGGFVTVHDATLQEGQTFASVRGTSDYLPPGTHEDVEVTLDDPVTEGTTLIAMAHRDTDGDRQYTFVESQGQADGPYVANGAVVDPASVEVAGAMSPTATPTATPTMTDTPTATPTPTEGGGPGFGPVVALVALLAGALVLARRP